jgi:hypothetical protein
MEPSSGGQATVEYIFILAFAILLGTNIINKYSDFFRSSMGNVSHVLSGHLTIGVCATECWFEGYVNRYSGTD